MEFFDRLYETGIFLSVFLGHANVRRPANQTHASAGAVRKNGMLAGCVPNDVAGFTVNQEIGRVLLDDECDGFDVFAKADRQELLFGIFQTLCLGGALNQYEDSIGPYFELTKALYKHCVRFGLLCSWASQVHVPTYTL
jgi:hypothetical protein